METKDRCKSKGEVTNRGQVHSYLHCELEAGHSGLHQARWGQRLTVATWAGSTSRTFHLRQSTTEAWARRPTYCGAMGTEHDDGPDCVTTLQVHTNGKAWTVCQHCLRMARAQR